MYGVWWIWVEGVCTAGGGTIKQAYLIAIVHTEYHARWLAKWYRGFSRTPAGGDGWVTSVSEEAYGFYNIPACY